MYFYQSSHSQTHGNEIKKSKYEIEINFKIIGTKKSNI